MRVFKSTSVVFLLKPIHLLGVCSEWLITMMLHQYTRGVSFYLVGWFFSRVFIGLFSILTVYVRKELINLASLYEVQHYTNLQTPLMAWLVTELVFLMFAGSGYVTCKITECIRHNVIVYNLMSIGNANYQRRRNVPAKLLLDHGDHVLKLTHLLGYTLESLSALVTSWVLVYRISGVACGYVVGIMVMVCVWFKKALRRIRVNSVEYESIRHNIGNKSVGCKVQVLGAGTLKTSTALFESGIQAEKRWLVSTFRISLSFALTRFLMMCAMARHCHTLWCHGVLTVGDVYFLMGVTGSLCAYLKHAVESCVHAAAAWFKANQLASIVDS